MQLNIYASLILLSLIALAPKDIYCQATEFEGVIGTWKIENYVPLIHFNLNKEEKKEHDIRIKNLLKSEVIIESRKIYALPAQPDYFTDCSIMSAIRKDFQVDSTEYIHSDSIGRGLVRLLGYPNFQKMKVVSAFDTKCSIDWGDETLKIFLIDKNNATLYCGALLLLLKR